MRARRAAWTILQRLIHFRTRGEKRRNSTEHGAGEHGTERGKGEYGGIDRYARAWQFAEEATADEFDTRLREQQAHRATDDGDDEALRERLSKQAEPPSTER